MSDFLSRNFTRREKTMIVVLLAALLVGLYFLAVHYPVVNRMEQIEQETAEVDGLIETAEGKAAEYTAMKQELDKILSQPEEDVTVMPPYNNVESLMSRLDAIFHGTNANFSFGQAAITDHVAARKINFSCSAKDYQEARRLLRDVTGTGWRCLLDSFTLAPVNGSLFGSELQVSGVITFYEYVRQGEEAGDESL